MSEKSSRTPDAVHKLADKVVGGAGVVLATGRDTKDLAFGVSQEAASSVAEKVRDTSDTALALGQSAANLYRRATIRTIELGSAAIKNIGMQVPLLNKETKTQFFGDNEPSLGDRPQVVEFRAEPDVTFDSQE